MTVSYLWLFDKTVCKFAHDRILANYFKKANYYASINILTHLPLGIIVLKVLYVYSNHTCVICL